MTYGNTVVPMNCYCSTGSCVVPLDRECAPFYEISAIHRGIMAVNCRCIFTYLYLHIILSSL